MRNPKVFFSIFAAVGVLFILLAAYVSYSSVSKMGSWQTASGVITGSDDGSPSVSFELQGKSYEFVSAFSSSDMRRGDAVIVHFPPGEPEEAEIRSFLTLWFVPILFSVFAAIFGPIGFIGLRAQKRRAEAKERLFTQRQGRKISAPGSVQMNKSYSVNGVYPYFISVQWLDPASNTMHTFKSENIWYNPSQVVEGKKDIDVYIDPQNPKTYYVDTTFLPKQA